MKSFNKYFISCLGISLIFINFSCQTIGEALVSEKNPVDRAHDEIWRRFVDTSGIILDYTDLRGQVYKPTKQECVMNYPNALGWWSPIENGAMFNGTYIDGLLLRWEKRKNNSDRIKIKKIVNGLLLLSNLSKVEGFVGRGVADDGISHYPMGSNDQTGGWFYGLFRYWQSDIPTVEEKALIGRRIVDFSKIIIANNWKIPAEPPFNFRGSFSYLDYNCTRLLFVCRAAYEISKDEYWRSLYYNSLSRRIGNPVTSRLEIIKEGIVYRNNATIWVDGISVACLRVLWEMETDSTIKVIYRKGLENSAEKAVQGLKYSLEYNRYDSTEYNINWRVLNRFWSPQYNEQEASEVATRQLDFFARNFPRWHFETFYVREPIYASWIISMSPDNEFLKRYQNRIKEILSNYDYNTLYTIGFLPVESIWWRFDKIQ